MWVTPSEVLISGPLFWSVERANPHFLLQVRKGRASGTNSGSGLTGLLVGTLDAVMDTKPPTYRILHQAQDSEVRAFIRPVYIM